MSSFSSSIEALGSKIRKGDPGSIQTNALNDLVSEINKYVKEAQAEKDFGEKVPDIEARIREIERQKNVKGITDDKLRDLENEIAKQNQLLADARSAYKNYTKRRTVLTSVNGEVDKLRSALFHALRL